MLSGTDNTRRYWSDLKRKLAAAGSELYEKIVQLKITAAELNQIVADLIEGVVEDKGKFYGKNSKMN